MTHLTNGEITALSLIILGWTAIETARARRSSNRSNELSLLPVLLGKFIGREIDNEELVIENVGSGVAFDIRIDPWSLCILDMSSIWQMKFEQPSTNTIQPGNEVQIKRNTFINGEASPEFTIMKGNMRYSKTPIDLTIHFKNMLNHKYHTRIRLVDGRTILASPPMRVNILWKIKDTALNIKYWSKIKLYCYKNREKINRKIKVFGQY